MELLWQNDALVEKWVLKGARVLFWAAALASAALCILLGIGPAPAAKEIACLPTTSVDNLGQGPLALNTSQSEELILKELVLVGANTRPDQDRVCSLALRSSGEAKTCSMGETLFFEMKDGVLVFAHKSTDLAVTVRSLENEMLLCEVKNGSTSATSMLRSSTIFQNPLQQESYLAIFQQGAVWGKDVFLSGWGGDEYRGMTSKTKISLGPDVYFLAPGDCLWWNGELWVSDIESGEVGPVAQLTAVSLQGADFKVWDSSGFSSEAVHIGMQTSPKKHLKLDELMTAIRPRSPSEVTCQLGKRRVIVREGDWWIHAEGRWKLVRTVSDLEACLYHQIPGELFMFEKVETSKGKVTLKGHVFDRMRTYSEPVSLVLQAEKKSPSPGKPSTGSPHLAKHKSHPPIVSQSPENI